METANERLEFTQTGNSSIREIHHFLSPEECQDLLATAKEKGFEPTKFNQDHRKCERLHTIEPKLSKALLKRLRPFLPEIVIIDGARWRLNRFTHHWRFVHYTPGGHFVPHYDGAKLLPWREISVFTVQIYLNQDFTGGSTRFYMDYQPHRQPPHDIGYGVVSSFQPKGPPTHVVTPETGKALVFNHTQNVLHDGETVFTGEKDILRGDVLYSLVPEDKHLLENPTKSPENLMWSQEVADQSGTRSYAGEVWKCGCGEDFCGMNRAEPPTTKKLLVRNGERLEFFKAGGKKIAKDSSLGIIAVNGKRASGKDYLTDRLQKTLENRGYKVYRASSGAINKRIYATQTGIDLSRLETDREFKEQHRLEMIAHHQKRSQENPAWALQQILEDALARDADVLLLSDLRTRQDLRWLQRQSDDAVFIRVDATDAARKERGWKPDLQKDSLSTETELDDYTGWMTRFDNSDNSSDSLIEDWIQLTILPRLGEV